MSNSAILDGSEPMSAQGKIVPTHMAHIVMKTAKYREMIDWYKSVFHATSPFSTETITFLTFDGEHHRFAFVDISKKAVLIPPNAIGVAHFAFTYGSVEDLVSTYERLKSLGITPTRSTNHDLTVSMYYRDPDANEIELQADIFATEEESLAVFSSASFVEKPFGRRYDADVFSQSFRDGAPLAKALANAEAAISG